MGREGEVERERERERERESVNRYFNITYGQCGLWILQQSW
jgi:hypothetical protein